MDIKKEKVVTILGSTSEIGLSLAKRYLSQGNKLNLSYRKIKNLKILKENLNFSDFNKNLSFFKINTNNKKNFTNSIIDHKNVFKKTDLLIVTIGEQGEIQNFFESDLKKFEKTIFINFMLYVILFRNLKNVLKKKNMLIILFSGGGSTSYRQNFSSYSLSKILLVKLTEILSHEIANKNVRFNIISPGIIKSNMTKKIIKNKKHISRKEFLKIKKNIKYSNNNLEKLFKTINFLHSKKGKQINGKMISSAWDKIDRLDKKKYIKLLNSDLYTLRRKDF